MRGTVLPSHIPDSVIHTIMLQFTREKTYKHTRMHACALLQFPREKTYKHTRMHTHTCVHMHTHTHLRTYTHTHSNENHTITYVSVQQLYLWYIGKPLQNLVDTCKVIVNHSMCNPIVEHDLHTPKLVVAGVHLSPQHLSPTVLKHGLKAEHSLNEAVVLAITAEQNRLKWVQSMNIMYTDSSFRWTGTDNDEMRQTALREHLREVKDNFCSF